MAHKVTTEILIRATPAKVWGLLTSFSSYPAWHVYINSFSGPLAVGSHVTINFESGGGKQIAARVRVLTMNSDKELSWSGHLWLPGLVDGVHRFELLGHADGTTTLTQSETFSGLLVPLLKKTFDKNNTKAFHDLNLKLKELAEAP